MGFRAWELSFFACVGEARGRRRHTRGVLIVVRLTETPRCLQLPCAVYAGGIFEAS